MRAAQRYLVAGPALVTILILILAVAGCSRKRSPTTDVSSSTGAADTTAVPPPGEADRADEMLEDRLEAARGVISEPIYFDFNRSEIRSDSRDVLSQKVDVLTEYPEIAVRIEGHADERGTVEYNLALGERRAQAAKDYLANAGVDPSRLTTISYGEERPAVEESNESAWAQNRRDEFIITSTAGGGF